MSAANGCVEQHLARCTRFIALATVLSIRAHANDPAPPKPEPLRLELPFAAGSTYACIQGNGGEFSHSDPASAFAYDFALPEGTPVLAAAAGRVLQAVDIHTAGGVDPQLKPFFNHVWIDHGGGHFTSYLHLQARSCRVVVGQLVAAGQVIAASGNTGYSAGPHLHFSATNFRWESVPSAFLDVRENGGTPAVGCACTSANDGVGTSWFVADSPLPADAFATEGVRIESLVPAVYWNRREPYELKGRIDGSSVTACFFVRPWAQYAAIAMKPAQLEADRSFRLYARIGDFEPQLDISRWFAYGVAPALDRSYRCERMTPLVLWEHDFDAQKKRIAPLWLPFPAGRAARYERTESARPDETAVLIRLPAGTPVLASAAGRIVAIDVRASTHAAARASASASVALDHGDGVITVYDGIGRVEPTLRIGHVVRAGHVLGTSDRSPASPDPHVVLRVRARAGESRPTFAELGESAAFAASGIATASITRVERLVFRADSLAPPDAFAERGITDLAGVPERTFHVGTRYVARGWVEPSVTSVRFAVRRRGASEQQVIASVTPWSRSFELPLQLGDAVDDGAWEWSLYARTGLTDPAGGPWLPLTVMR